MCGNCKEGCCKKGGKKCFLARIFGCKCSSKCENCPTEGDKCEKCMNGSCDVHGSKTEGNM